MKINLKKLILSTFFVSTVNLMGVVDFASREAHVAVKTSESKVFIKTATGVTGWSQDSIVKSYGNITSNTWTEAYPNNTTISFSSAPTNMVYNNSNAINAGTGGGNTALVIQTSNAVNRMGPILRTTSHSVNVMSPIVRTTSNLINVLTPLVKQTSNAVNRMGPILRTTSHSVNVMSPIVRTTSNLINVLTPLVKQNSNAINALGSTSTLSTLVRTTSNLINVLTPLVKQNSNAINALGSTSTLSTLVRQNSNAINSVGSTSSLAALVRTTSNAFANKCPLIIANSNALNALGSTSTLSTLVRQNSNAINGLGSTSSLATLVRTTSNAFANKCPLIIANSNALNALGSTSTLSTLVRQNSNAINGLGSTSSLATLVRTTSNAFANKCPLIIANSNAINSLDDRVADNEADIITNTMNIAANSTAIKNNSNAIAVLAPLVKATSNAVTSGLTPSTLAIQNSNAILVKCMEIKNNSNAITDLVPLVKATSNTVSSGMTPSTLAVQNSNAILVKCMEIKNNSNAITDLAPLVKATSNTVSSGMTPSILAVQNSNALVYGIKNNSNAITALCPLVKQNSNAIVKIRADLSTIDALVPNIDVDVAYYQLAFDLFISLDNLLRANVSTVINGNGHAIRFARDLSNIFQIMPGITVTLTNVVLKDFDDAVIGLGAGSQLIFGSGTVVELADKTALSRDWIFQDSAILSGFGSTLDLAGSSIQLMQGGTLALRDVFLDGVRDTNIRCVGDYGCIALCDTTLCLARDFTFTTASLLFERDVVVTGTNIFTYESHVASTIDSCSTLFFDKGTTFSYAPRTRDYRDLLEMRDVTSNLILFGSTLKSTTTGLRLTKGTVCIDHKVTVFNDSATTLSESICLGNGIAADDLNIQLLPGASLSLQSGILNYENVN